VKPLTALVMVDSVEALLGYTPGASVRNPKFTAPLMRGNMGRAPPVGRVGDPPTVPTAVPTVASKEKRAATSLLQPLI
jgi:hypothetical protein